MGDLTVIIVLDPNPAEHFTNLMFNTVTPKWIIDQIMLRGRKPPAGSIWKMTKTSHGNGTDMAQDASLTANNVVDGNFVYLVI